MSAPPFQDEPNNRWWVDDNSVDPELPVAPRHFSVPIPLDLMRGSEVEMAGILADSTERKYGRLIFADGNFWVFMGTMWHPVPEHMMRRLVHQFDKATVNGKTAVKIKSSTVSGVLKECIAVCAEPDYFNNPAVGLNTRSCVVTIDASGKVSHRVHDPNDRHRFMIEADYDPDTDPYPPRDTLLETLLTGSFLGDADAQQKIDLIGEIFGAAAYGFATHLRQPKAFIFHGETANNGKSNMAALLEKLLPRSAVSHIPLSAFSDEKRIVNLAGKAANVVEELSSKSVSGENFKAAITGQPIEGRDLYKSAVTFYPRALHVATTNVLPSFEGGIDRGLQRRLVVVRFNRTIPDEEIIPDIAQRIGDEEMDLLVSFAVDGARRLVQNGAYTMPQSSIDAMKDWLLKEPVNAWFEEKYRIDPTQDNWLSTKLLYESFISWCSDEGISDRFRVSRERFSQKLFLISGVAHRRISSGTQICHIRDKI